MKVLVTGATGYLGSNIVRRLLTDGHEVAAFKRPESSLSRVLEVHNDISWYYSDEPDLSKPFKRHDGFDAIIHTATCYGRNGESSATVFDANVAFPVRLLDIATHYNTATFLSTDTYFNTDIICSSYLSFYALSKKQFAEWGKMVSSQRGIRFVNIKLEHIYGPNDDPCKFTTHIIHQCLKNVPSIALTQGAQLRDFIYIDDAVCAYNMMLQKHTSLPGGYQNVGLGSGTAISIREFVELVHTLCNSTSKLDFGALPYRENEIMQSIADISFLLLLGWKPSMTLDSRLSTTIEAEKKLI